MSQYPGNDNTTGNYQPQQPPAYPNQAQPPAYSATQPGYYAEQGGLMIAFEGGFNQDNHCLED